MDTEHAQQSTPQADSSVPFCKSNPVPGDRLLSYGFENQIDSPTPMPMYTPPTTPHLLPRRQPLPSFEGAIPRGSPTPQAEDAGPVLPQPPCPGIVSHTPSAALLSYLGLVPRSPFAAFVSYLDPATRTRDWQTSAKPAPPSEGRTKTRIQAAPILARIKSRSWTASPQARRSRKNARKRYDSTRITAATVLGSWAVLWRRRV